jgi:hypothetical protein
MPLPVQVEYEGQRIKIRTFNKKIYRLSHWPIWIWVFFLAPGPLTFDLFAHGFSRGNFAWLICVLVGTGIAGVRGNLPGVEPAPYILRFTEDRPNPLYRRVCYTFAWSDIVTFASLNLAGLAYAAFTGRWRMKQIYDHGYFQLYVTVLALGAVGWLPRVRPSTKGEGTERRYFYGSVWAVTFAQTLELILWKLMTPGRSADVAKFGIYTLALIAVGFCAMLGLLPRTRPIIPGEMMIGD